MKRICLSGSMSHGFGAQRRVAGRLVLGVTWPCISICSRKFGAKFVIATLAGGILVSLHSAGNSLSAPSLAAPPSVFPSKSFGALIGLSGFTATVKGGGVDMTSA